MGWAFALHSGLQRAGVSKGSQEVGMLRLHQVLGLWVGHSRGPASDVALVLDLGVEGERRRAEPLPL